MAVYKICEANRSIDPSRRGVKKELVKLARKKVIADGYQFARGASRSGAKPGIPKELEISNSKKLIDEKLGVTKGGSSGATFTGGPKLAKEVSEMKQRLWVMQKEVEELKKKEKKALADANRNAKKGPLDKYVNVKVKDAKAAPPHGYEEFGEDVVGIDLRTFTPTKPPNEK